jgi:hypothetical protein
MEVMFNLTLQFSHHHFVIFHSTRIKQYSFCMNCEHFQLFNHRKRHASFMHSRPCSGADGSNSK